MGKWWELISAIYHYLRDDFDRYPENDHEMRVVNAIIVLKGERE